MSKFKVGEWVEHHSKKIGIVCSEKDFAGQVEVFWIGATTWEAVWHENLDFIYPKDDFCNLFQSEPVVDKPKSKPKPKFEVGERVAYYYTDVPRRIFKIKRRHLSSTGEYWIYYSDMAAQDPYRESFIYKLNDPEILREGDTVKIDGNYWPLQAGSKHKIESLFDEAADLCYEKYEGKGVVSLCVPLDRLELVLDD